jgi:hypothetical protein
VFVLLRGLFENYLVLEDCLENSSDIKGAVYVLESVMPKQQAKGLAFETLSSVKRIRKNGLSGNAGMAHSLVGGLLLTLSHQEDGAIRLRRLFDGKPTKWDEVFNLYVLKIENLSGGKTLKEIFDDIDTLSKRMGLK